MMSKTTVQALKLYRAHFGENTFTAYEFEKKRHQMVAQHLPTASLQTLINNGIAITIDKVIEEDYTIDEIIQMLNDCSGEDCYCGSWHIQRDGDRIYDVRHETVYKLK